MPQVFKDMDDYFNKSFNKVFHVNDPANGDITQGDVTAKRMEILDDDGCCDDLLCNISEMGLGADLVRAMANRDVVRINEIYNTAMNDMAMNQLENK